jgi:hypothetical protein
MTRSAKTLPQGLETGQQQTFPEAQAAPPTVAGLEGGAWGSPDDALPPTPHLHLKSQEPAARSTLLGCQSRLRTVERIGFLMCLHTHLDDAGARGAGRWAGALVSRLPASPTAQIGGVWACWMWVPTCCCPLPWGHMVANWPWWDLNSDLPDSS